MTPEALANLKELELPGRDGPKQKEVLIVWDIENCRIPVGVPAREVEKAISNAFLYLHRRKKAGFACSISEESLAALSSAYGRPDADYLKTHTKMVMAAGGGKYKSSDTKLLEEIESFVVRQSRDDRTAQSVLVVITGDGDFTKAILQAMDQGMDLEVLHPLGMTSRNLLWVIWGGV
ncbi:hypothetical protein TSOC_008455 [Tetrabaena socialis]|uniref:NYN domain-containing protein n=1 Tax=Tetrabaena socialis TaxID=47790 RepID=A0A2J7ZYE2_9CHLO|nr:hypothetical protein TSOC_008455 [Tetrabaena socialis]|eukprot:PNH05278.1 hypothetical protein TSOC_008455 [Tetrabaena socialis]